jgi:hypothetical protein
MEGVYIIRIPNYASNKVAELEKTFSIKIGAQTRYKRPDLLQHGGQYKRVSVENSKWLAELLTKLVHPHKLSIYEGEGRGWGLKSKPIAIKELTDWFQQHL